MAVKRKGRKKVAKKGNPLVALKAKLADIKAKTAAMKAEAKETEKRTDALVKDMQGSSAAPVTKAKVVKKRRKKRVSKKK
ncbi:hypothetical protein MNBD_GAMMA10-3192 [hydrothermal vent metagenome]|uniref:Uncharacterized protein n=1 Tax=hydrothermal vent metagenome TaxID=652676 RepID=A0A3B0YNC6_9ZZZZ